MSVRRRMGRDPATGAPYEVWLVDVVFQHPDGKRTRVKKKSPVQTRRGAEEYERQVRNALLDGSFGKEVRKPVPTLAEFCPQFLSSYVANNNKLSEQSAKGGHFRHHLVPYFGAKRLDANWPKDVEAFKAAQLAEEYSKKAINNQLSTLRKLLNVAVEWGIIEHAPKIKPFKPEPIEFDFLTFEEAERLVRNAEPQPWRAVVITALNTGLRLGELMALRWDDVDLVSGKLKVRHSSWKGHLVSPKSGRHREVPLNARVLDVLKEHRHLRGEYVFCQDDGAPLTPQICRRALMRACKRAGLRHVQWHGLRHTFASHLTMRRVPMKAVQELLGHATITMTLRYSHLSPDVRKDAVNALLDEDETASRPGCGPATASGKKV